MLASPPRPGHELVTAVLTMPGATRLPRRSDLRTVSRPRRVVRHDHRGRDRPRRRRRRSGSRAPAGRRPCETACQMPSIATTRPICSFVRHAAPAQSAKGSSRSSSRNQIAAEEERCRERDRVKVVDDEPLRRGIEEVDERETEARPSPPRCLRASRKTGTAPRATATAWRPGAAQGSATATRAARRAPRAGRSALRAGRSGAPEGRSSRGSGRAPSTRRPA